MLIFGQEEPFTDFMHLVLWGALKEGWIRGKRVCKLGINHKQEGVSLSEDLEGVYRCDLTGFQL